MDNQKALPLLVHDQETKRSNPENVAIHSSLHVFCMLYQTRQMMIDNGHFKGSFTGNHQKIALDFMRAVT